MRKNDLQQKGGTMIILDYQDRRPIYEQITEKFRTLIYQGALPAGSRLPSVRQLAMELSINPNTIQRAYMTLEQEGPVSYTHLDVYKRQSCWYPSLNEPVKLV